MNPTGRSMNYQIRLQGHLNERWLRWFEGLEIILHPEGETIISGMMDQSTLHSVLNRVRDLGVEIISIQREVEQN